MCQNGQDCSLQRKKVRKEKTLFYNRKVQKIISIVVAAIMIAGLLLAIFVPYF